MATLMDLFTREIVGWSLSTKHTKDLLINAFLDGLKTTGKRPEKLSTPIKEWNIAPEIIRSSLPIWL